MVSHERSSEVRSAFNVLLPNDVASTRTTSAVRAQIKVNSLWLATGLVKSLLASGEKHEQPHLVRAESPASHTLSTHPPLLQTMRIKLSEKRVELNRELQVMGLPGLTCEDNCQTEIYGRFELDKS
jgi:hypothetical protein